MDGGVGFLRGDGEMARRIGVHDWSGSLGAIEAWPGSLRTVVGVVVHSPVPIVLLWGADGIMIYNDAYSVFAGGRHPSLLGQKVREGWPEVGAFNDNVMQVGLAGGTLAYRDQELTLYRTGHPEQVWMNLDYSPVIDESGRPGGVIAIVVETTQRVLAERLVAAERDRLAQLFEQAPTFMAMLSGPEHRIELANPGYQQLVGNRALVGRTIAEALPDAAAQGYLALLDQVFSSGAAFAANGARYLVRATAEAPAIERFVDFVYQPVKDAAGATIGIFVEGADVTERARADAALRASEARLRELAASLEARVAERTAALEASEARLRTIFETGYQYQGLFSPDGIVLDANATSLSGIGATLAEVVGRPAWETPWFAGTAEMQAYVREAMGLAASGQMQRREVRLELPVGGWRWLDLSLRPLRDGAGAVVAIVLEAVDFTERRAAEEALVQSQKMEAVGQLTGGIAHDFNNLLTGIIGSLELLHTRAAQGRTGELDRYIRAAHGAARRAASLTQRLLAFSRRQTLAPRPVDINRLVDGMEELLRRTTGPEVALEVAAEDGLWATLIDPGQLESALLNLVINARDAMPAGGRLAIRTGNLRLDARAARDWHLPAGACVALRVSDSGAGMAPEVVARAFDPFFTTKPIGMGTGLGLSMVYGFVRQSGGQVRIDSAPGEGTTVSLYLPRHDGAAEQGVAAPAEPAPRAVGQESVLVVDDEATLRMLVTDVLQDLGYRPIAAADGSAGLDVLTSGAPVDLMVTDVGLPGGMNGRQLAAAARRLRPAMPVLFITGFAESAVLSAGSLEPGMHVLTKPFAMETLAARIRDLLGAR
jgi:PAS domain S-box-containing protein